MAEITRRDLLKGIAAAGACGLVGCSKYAGTETLAPVPEGWDRGEERVISTVCGQCQAACGIRVRVYEGRAIKIDGNPDSPVNKGGIGPKGQSGIQVLYHPDRIRGPLVRDGERGAGKWKPIAWDEAIRQVSRRLMDLRARGTPQSLLVLDSEPRGILRELWERFLAAYGSPNHVTHESAVYGGKVLAMAYMHGVAELPAYDWEKTEYVLGFGASLFESWCQTIHFTRASSHLKRGLPGHRVKFVQVSPRYSVTAAKADEWIAIEPATYGALALGIAHVLIKEDLYDKEFVRDHTYGFDGVEDGAGPALRGFKRLVMEDYPPAKVSKLTGIDVETIERIAHEMAEHRPAVALADGNAAAATNGLGTAMAIHALNALLGNLERPGGMLVQRRPPYAAWPAVTEDEAARKGLAAQRIDGSGTANRPLAHGCIQDLPEAILSGKPYPVEALLLSKSNPAFSKPSGGDWVKALRQVPLVVSFSPLPDESTLWADFVLPDHTYLERWEVMEPVPSVGYPVLGLRQPVVTPVHDTRATGDVLLQIAKAMGKPMCDAFPWDDYRAASLARLGGAVKADALERTGSWSAPGYPFEQWDKAFPTPSGKFEFCSQAIVKRLEGLFPGREALTTRLKDSGVVTKPEDLGLPHWEPPVYVGSAEEYPFILLPYRAMDYAEGGVRHIPYLRELPRAGRRGWKERVELHPEDAKRLGLKAGDAATVESVAGKRRLWVEVNQGIRPGTVATPLGHGTWPPKAEETPTGGYGLLANLSDPLAGILALYGTRVRVTKEGV